MTHNNPEPHNPTTLTRANNFVVLVPTARLELAQLAPLPPQDSVSTNFTTSAFFAPPKTKTPGKLTCVTSVFLLPWKPHLQHPQASHHQPEPAARQTQIVPPLASNCQSFLAYLNQYRPTKGW